MNAHPLSPFAVALRLRSACATVLLATLVALGACDPEDDARVEVEYRQIANFHTYTLGSGSFSANGGQAIFVLYRITRISNTGAEAKPYVFDRSRVVTVTSDNTTNDEPAGENVLLGAKLVNGLTVQPGETKLNAGCIVKTHHTSNPASLLTTGALVDLFHQVTPQQPVTMKRAAGNQSIALIVGGDATASQLQQLCGT